MDLDVITFKPTLVTLIEFSKVVNETFQRLLNLDCLVDLNINLRTEYKGEKFDEFTVSDDLFHIESVFLDRYLDLRYDLDEYWQDYGFSEPAYFFSFFNLKGKDIYQLAFATSIAIALAKIMDSDCLYTCNLWTDLMQPTNNLDFVLIKDILEKASNPNTQPLTDESYRIFNARALNVR